VGSSKVRYCTGGDRNSVDDDVMRRSEQLQGDTGVDTDWTGERVAAHKTTIQSGARGGISDRAIGSAASERVGTARKGFA